MSAAADRVEPPAVKGLAALARLDGVELRPGEDVNLWPVVVSLTSFADLLDRLEGELPLPTPSGRKPGYLPSAAENPYNAFIRRCEIRESNTGPLAGRTIGLKDNISLAGVPTTNGSRVSGYVPVHDAVVVERLLAAGATIVGKLNMDDFGSSGLGETSAFGPCRNPIDPTRSAGGSSGGSGAAVRSREVDMSLAVDQGGSGRIPAAFCGVVAMKATHGLVPSWGITHIDHTIDFVTPVGRTVYDVALLLEVIGGEDWRDAQWVRGAVAADDYTGAESEGAGGLRLGLVTESFDPAVCEPDVIANGLRAAAVLESAGAQVENISIPLWADGLSIFLPYVAHLFSDNFRGGGQGSGHLGAYDIPILEAFLQIQETDGAQLPDQVKAWLLADRHVHERYAGVPYARLHNIRLAIRRAISAALGRYDALLTPTLPLTAPPLLKFGASFEELSARTATSLCYNTAPLNLSGHPAISLPNGTDHAGMPTALQVVTRHFDERTGFRIGFVLERETGPFVRDPSDG